MQTDLTQEQIDQYRHDGFLVVRQFLTPEQVAELKGAVIDCLSQMGDRFVAGVEDVPTEEPESRFVDQQDEQQRKKYYAGVFTQKLNLHRINDTIRHYMLNPKLGEMLCRLEGLDGIRVWHDQTLIKEPYGSPTAWHLDNPYWSFHSEHAISIWIALEDATLGNGCMWFVPGTHKMADCETNVPIGPNLKGLFEVYPEMAKIDTVAAPMKAGDCSFHNGLTAHGAGANMTRGRRIAMTCAYMPEGSTFNGQRNILPEDYFNALEQGDVLDNDDWNPLVWSSRTAQV